MTYALPNTTSIVNSRSTQTAPNGKDYSVMYIALSINGSPVSNTILTCTASSNPFRYTTNSNVPDAAYQGLSVTSFNGSSDLYFGDY